MLCRSRGKSRTSPNATLRPTNQQTDIFFQPSNKVTFTAGGEKVRTYTDTEKRDYIAGFEIVDEEVESYQFGDGRILFHTPEDEPTLRHQFYLKDHLGNTMVTFEDKNDDGVVVGNTEDMEPGTEEIVQRNLYYPFGMSVNRDWWQNAPAPVNVTDQDYRYNGKELETEYGLDWYFYGARMYDPAVGRFMGVDPIADQFAFVSVYNYAENEPVAHIDLWGLQAVTPDIGVYLIKELDASIQSLLYKIDRRQKIVFGGVDPSSIPYREYGVVETWNGFEVGYKDLPQEPGFFRRQSDVILDGLGVASITPGGKDAATLVARVPNSFLHHLVPTEFGAQADEVVQSIMRRMDEGDLFIYNEPIHTVTVSDQTYILDGHNRIEAARRGGHDLDITNLSEAEAMKLYPDKLEQIKNGEFD